MSEVIIGRKNEQEILRQRIESKSPELIAIYGRRRIGKTYLVRQYFNDTFSFYSTGIYQGTKKEQLGEFTRQLEHYSGRKWKVAKDWFDAFCSSSLLSFISISYPDEHETNIPHNMKKYAILSITKLLLFYNKRLKYLFLCKQSQKIISLLCSPF